MKRSDDIKDYLRGNRRGMSAHQLEREALSDPFLYEALEGLTTTPGDPIGGLIRMERQLETRVRSSRGKSRGWLYVAASFLILAICGTVWLSRVRDEKPLPLVDMALLSAGDARSAGENDLEEMVAMSADVAGTQGNDSSANVVEGIVTDEKTRGGMDEVVVSGRGKEKCLKMKAATASGDIIVADRGEGEDLKVRLTTVFADTGMVKMRIQGARAVNFSVPDSLDDVARFNRYMEKALRFPKEDLESNRAGVIQVSFVLNEKKVPSNIRVKDGFSKECNKEMIRLLTEGPEWKNTPAGKRVHAKVYFTIRDKQEVRAVLEVEKPKK